MSFLAPLFLIGALGLALPWLLHRFSRHNPDEVAFPSSLFLEPTTPPVSRTRQLRHKALFALRCLLLLGLIFLFAEPFINKPLVAEDEFHHTLLIDRSLSMQAGKRFERAREQALSLLDTVGEGSAAELLVFDSELVGVAPLTTDIGEVRRAIGELEVGASAADYGELMQQLDALLGTRAHPTTVTLFTDAQTSNLPAQLRRMLAPHVEELNIVQTDSEALINASIQGQAITEDGATARVAVTASLTASDKGSEELLQANKTLRIAHNDRILATVPMTLSTDAHQTKVIDDLPLPATDTVILSLSLSEEDDLALDNSIKIAVFEVQPIEVNLVDLGSEGNPSASVFLRTAFQTNGRAQVLRGARDLSALGNSADHVVVLADLRTLNWAGSGIPELVDAGGNVLVVNKLGSGINRSNENELSRVGQIESGHPLGLGDSDWLSTRFYDIPLLELTAEDRVLLATTTGAPVLVERATSAGRLLLLTDPLDAEVSDLPLQPAFVDLIQNILTYFTASSALPTRAEVGELVSLPANVQLIDSNGDALLDITSTNSAQEVRLSVPGIYTILTSNRGEHSLEIVLPPNESDLRIMSQDEIDVWEQNDPGGVDSEETQQPTTALPANITVSADAIERPKIEFWRWILPVLVVLVLLESLYANTHLNIRRDGS